MSDSIQSVQNASQQTQVDQTVQPVKTAKTEQHKNQITTPQDQVTLSDDAQQSLTGLNPPNNGGNKG